jgi:3-dehydroquinate dehydratase type I
MDKAVGAIKAANHVADLIELRVDYVKYPDLAALIENAKKPLIVTNRRSEEGGRFRGNEQERYRVLREAVTSGVQYVDAEMRSNRALLQTLIEDRNGTKIILSFHDFQGTPSQKELRAILDRMIRLEADVIKIVTFARSLEDNLTMLSLILYARERSRKIVAFCMGEKGEMSRVFSPLMGAAWTYASLSSDRASAPGQLTIGEMRGIWKGLR